MIGRELSKREATAFLVQEKRSSRATVLFDEVIFYYLAVFETVWQKGADRVSQVVVVHNRARSLAFTLHTSARKRAGARLCGDQIVQGYGGSTSIRVLVILWASDVGLSSSAGKVYGFRHETTRIQLLDSRHSRASAGRLYSQTRWLGQRSCRRCNRADRRRA